jgi:uncharacterized iron-regulated protein
MANRYYTLAITIIMLGGLSLALISCATQPKQLLMTDINRSYQAGTIVSGQSGEPLTFDELIADLVEVDTIYIGEQHTNRAHHRVQLEIIEGLAAATPKNLAIGMEMFDTTYQAVLSKWSNGELTSQEFLKRTQWYANWRYPFDLYAAILAYIRDARIPLLALNIPSYLPSRIAVGGVDNLTDSDRAFLPASIDTGNLEHRAYVEGVYNQHPMHRRKSFDYFYEAQCVWEDAMATEVAKPRASDVVMIVLVGNGHIIKKFGIPSRAFKRDRLNYRTIYLAMAGEKADLSYGDYIWITDPDDKAHP